MSRFWAGASSDESSSDGDDDDSWASSGDGDDSDDGTGTDSDSDDDDDDDDKPARGRSKYAYDSDDDSDFSDEQRVVRSALEKRYRKVNDVVGELRDAMQSHNWNGVSAEFDRLHRVLNDTQLLPSALSGAPPPPAYVATLALLERLVERTLATRKAGGKRGGKGGGGGGGGGVVKLSATNAKSLNAMKQKLKKNNGPYADAIAAYQRELDERNAERKADRTGGDGDDDDDDDDDD
eukprot:CAMPEP_0198310696 /NCGR_PEP_ID=MMETSP1450-20131203/2657_1 /TAXON_ID=753684 ORGANISM="Madagascaria erythrocladiodes, Strain CCMP3234" /NCGR_SAMPLE_ID=MMETSP1450 /ASSEMBLY_ACC=CAM_ASM_001115 /LENGTH=235 /DNA_ID=CAMNT_0044013539 /DNA_START=78 /DNA_END=782 /DNA_ORIENTATION=-